MTGVVDAAGCDAEAVPACGTPLLCEDTDLVLGFVETSVGGFGKFFKKSGTGMVDAEAGVSTGLDSTGVESALERVTDVFEGVSTATWGIVGNEVACEVADIADCSVEEIIPSVF